MTTAATSMAKVVLLRDYRTASNGDFSWANDNFKPWSSRVLLRELAEKYQTDEMSGFAKKRWVTQVNYRSLIRRLVDDIGDRDLETFKIRDLKERHAVWSSEGKITMGHGIVSMFRILIGFGAGIQEDPACQRIKGGLSAVSFPNGKPRKSILTETQVMAICDRALADAALSIATGHTLQWWCGFRQKDIIGEYVPVNSDPRPAIIILGDLKWVGGITAEEINDNRVLTHTTSKRNKTISIPLADCPISEAEWAALPKSGPLILDPRTSKPFRPWNYTRIWREYADDVGVPRDCVNMDTRAGRITSLLAGGASLDDTRKFATHSQVSTTMGYSRGEDEAVVRALDAVREEKAA